MSLIARSLARLKSFDLVSHASRNQIILQCIYLLAPNQLSICGLLVVQAQLTIEKIARRSTSSNFVISSPLAPHNTVPCFQSLFLYFLWQPKTWHYYWNPKRFCGVHTVTSLRSLSTCSWDLNLGVEWTNFSRFIYYLIRLERCFEEKKITWRLNLFKTSTL